MTAPPDSIKIDELDTVATALRDLGKGELVSVAGPAGEFVQVVLLEPVLFGHKFALCEVKTADLVLKYGRPIGRATTLIPVGAHVHTHNLESLSAVDDVLPVMP